MVSKHFAIPALAVILLAGCGQNADKAESAAPAEAAAPAVSATTATAPAAAFDITKIPVSTAPLGVFPYITLPAGYVDGGGKTQDLARFPFWTGTAFEFVEGKVYQAGIRPDEGKTFSKLELQRGIERQVLAAGGVKVTESRIPSSASDALTDDVKVGMIDGLGDIYNDATTTYVIRRADRSIWVHVVPSMYGGAWTIAETEPAPAPPAAAPAA
jgi:OOP family OmpA-OmpF porin